MRASQAKTIYSSTYFMWLFEYWLETSSETWLDLLDTLLAYDGL